VPAPGVIADDRLETTRVAGLEDETCRLTPADWFPSKFTTVPLVTPASGPAKANGRRLLAANKITDQTQNLLLWKKEDPPSTANILFIINVPVPTFQYADSPDLGVTTGK